MQQMYFSCVALLFPDLFLFLPFKFCYSRKAQGGSPDGPLIHIIAVPSRSSLFGGIPWELTHIAKVRYMIWLLVLSWISRWCIQTVFDQASIPRTLLLIE